MSTGNIILIGFMGAGKSTIGKKLSKRLGLPFRDTDDMIEARAGKTIRAIFSEDGEAAFRRMETETLKELAEEPGRFVIACGGGLPMREENRKLLSDLGKVIYLKASAETLYHRLKKDTSRPLLQVQDPQSEIGRLLAEREAAYSSASAIDIDVNHCGHGAVLAKILQVFENKA